MLAEPDMMSAYEDVRGYHYLAPGGWVSGCGGVGGGSGSGT